MKFYYKNLHNTPSMFKLRLQRYKVFMKKMIKYEFFICYTLHLEIKYEKKNINFSCSPINCNAQFANYLIIQFIPR